MSIGNTGPSDLDEVLSRAIDRQLAEQRALRQALDGLTAAINTLIERAPPADEVDTGAITDRVQRAIESGTARLQGDLREIRDSIEPQRDPTPALTRQVKTVQDDVELVREEVKSVRDDVRSVHEDVGVVSESVTAVTADVEGIAQALIDLNAGLRTWADDVDASVEGLREAVDAIREMPMPSRTVAEDDDRPAPPRIAQDDRRLDEMERQVRETAELSLYITDQIEDLDAVLNRVSELPGKIEGAVAQAMRRALTLREKLDQGSSAAIKEIASSVKTGLASIDASLHTRLDEMESERRDTIEALVEAIDRATEGKALHASEQPAAGAPKTKPKPRARKPKEPASRRSRAKPAEPGPTP